MLSFPSWEEGFVLVEEVSSGPAHFLSLYHHRFTLPCPPATLPMPQCNLAALQVAMDPIAMPKSGIVPPAIPLLILWHCKYLRHPGWGSVGFSHSDNKILRKAYIKEIKIANRYQI